MYHLDFFSVPNLILPLEINSIRPPLKAHILKASLPLMVHIRVFVSISVVQQLQ